MKITNKTSLKIIAIIAILSFFNYKQDALACSCGCNVFNVGTQSLFPNSEGNLIFVEYGYANQKTPWHNNYKASANDIHHQQIKTQSVNVGFQKSFNRSWTMQTKVPFVKRLLVNKVHNHMSNSEGVEKINHNAIGDIKLIATYTGINQDMSSGINFGVKLPTGSNDYSKFGSSAQIGTGSTDIILGAYKILHLEQNPNLKLFSQFNFQRSITTSNKYRPGDELTVASGFGYTINNSKINLPKISPILQITAIKKNTDSQSNGDSHNTGYSQVFISPAIEVNFANMKAYFDVQMPIYRYVNGNQLVSNNLYRTIIGYNF